MVCTVAFHVETSDVTGRRLLLAVTALAVVAVGAIGLALGKACE